MCHVMKRLLSTIGVHPTVIEPDDEEIGALIAHSVTPTVATPMNPPLMSSKSTATPFAATSRHPPGFPASPSASTLS
ncbi:hypothetical protein AAG906_022374 [Vitis piasezkii]